VRQHFLAGGCTGGIALMQNRELPSGPLGGDQPERDLLVAQLDQLVGTEERLGCGAQIEREKLGQ
jgi:hypothetical protein